VSTFVTACVFCAIAAGDLPAHVVASSDQAMAFLDTRPVFPGHTLVIPRDHIETLADLPATQLASYFGFVQKVAAAVESGMSADGTFVAINNKISQSVPHLHTHVVPRRRKDGLRGFFWPRTKYGSDLAAEACAESIRAAFAAPVGAAESR
jgi:histidine triad (HIT) family protein